MFELQIGVGKISLRLRHAQSLKDKRKVVQSLLTKLRNRGCSATEASGQDNPKLAHLGFSYAASSASDVLALFSEVEKLLWGEFEVVEFNRDMVDYTNPHELLFTESILDEKDPGDEI